MLWKKIQFVKNTLYLKFCIIFIVLPLYFSCEKKSSTINIACASNLIDIFPRLIEEYEDIYGESNINITYGASGSLATQIIHGAPYALFFSADLKTVSNIKNNLDIENEIVIYCRGKLILFSRNGNISGFFDSNYISDKKVSIANPTLAPYGRAAEEYLSTLNIAIEDIIIAENIGQAIHYSINGCDYGILPKSSLNKNEIIKLINSKESDYYEIDEDSYSSIDQASIQLISDTDVSELYNFILSEKVDYIFEEYGYLRGGS